MKIALLSHHFPPKYYAGAEQYAYRIAQGLRLQGYTVEIVCIESVSEGGLYPTSARDEYEGLIVHRLRFNLELTPHPVEWGFRNPQIGYWMKDYLKLFRPDVVHINGGYLLGGAVFEAAFDLGLPTVLMLHDYWFLCPLITLYQTGGRVCSERVPPARCVWCLLSRKRSFRGLDRKLGGRLGDAFVALSQAEAVRSAMGTTRQIKMIQERQDYLQQIFEKVDLVVAPSRFVVEKMEEYRFKPRRLVYLPFGISIPDCEENPPALALGQPSLGVDHKLRIGYLGQFTRHKGVHILLKAFRRLEAAYPGTCELALHGDLGNEPQYERELRKIAHAHPSIRFAGPYPNSIVTQIISGLDVVVLPSLWYENRPTVLLEAHAACRPVVAARIGGIPELITHDKNGLLFEAGDVADLTAQLQRLIEEPGLLGKLRQGIRPADGTDKDTPRLVELYRSVQKTTRLKE